jgi:hypothetical protein
VDSARRAFAVIVLGLVVSGASGAEPPSPASRLAEGNRAYESGDFALAAERFESLVAEGYDTPAVLFNLGNARLKAGDHGRAIAAYERALLRAPRDRELIENLAIARARCVDRRHEPAVASREWFAERARGLTPNEWSLVLFASQLLVVWALVAPAFFPALAPRARTARLAGVALATLACLGLATWGERLKPGSRAVVVGLGADHAEISVRSGPGENYIGEFVLHAGSVVRVRGEREGWVKVEFSRSLRGWTEARGLEPL